MYNIYINFYFKIFTHFDFSQLPLWNSQEPAEHLGLPGVAALEHDGAELHHSLLLDMEDIVHPIHQGWRWMRHRIIVVLKLATIVIFISTVFCIQQIETKKCKRNPWVGNMKNKLVKSATIKGRHITELKSSGRPWSIVDRFGSNNLTSQEG